jgi:hypothetical protein
MVDFDNQNRKRCRHCKMNLGILYARLLRVVLSAPLSGLRSGTAEVQRQTTGNLQEG